MAAVLSAIKDMKGEMANLKRDMLQERKTADDRLVKRIKLDPKPVFKKKGNEKQFLFNTTSKTSLNRHLLLYKGPHQL